MKIFDPKEGQIINYWYLWNHESKAGKVEGKKDRTSAIVLAQDKGFVVVAPITHRPPDPGVEAIEIPQDIKKQAGLDHERSWIVVNDYNSFKWPGFDLQPIKNRADKTYIYGQFPPGFLKQIKTCFFEHAKKRTRKITNRDEQEGD